jgi:TonB family protein
MNLRSLAALFLSPLMVHAQVSTPAQPQTGKAPVLQAALAATGRPMLSAADQPATSPSARRVSTGVVAPKLIQQVPLIQNTISASALEDRQREAIVSMTVDASGRPSDLKIVQSAGKDVDDSILQAVGQYRYQPGTLDGQVFAIPVNLHVVVLMPVE